MRRLLSSVLMVLSFMCLGDMGAMAQSVKSNNSIEVLYFHGKQRCVTCNAIEKLTREVLNTSFANEVKNGRISMRIIDISNKDNEKIVDKHEVSWSSLIIVKHDGAEERSVNMTEIGFANAKSKPDVFKSKLSVEINKLLK